MHQQILKEKTLKNNVNYRGVKRNLNLHIYLKILTSIFKSKWVLTNKLLDLHFIILLSQIFTTTFVNGLDFLNKLGKCRIK